MNAAGYATETIAETIRRTRMSLQQIASRLGITVKELDCYRRGEGYDAIPPAVFIGLRNLADAADQGRRPNMYGGELIERKIKPSEIQRVTGCSRSTARRWVDPRRNPLLPLDVGFSRAVPAFMD